MPGALPPGPGSSAWPRGRPCSPPPPAFAPSWLAARRAAPCTGPLCWPRIGALAWLERLPHKPGGSRQRLGPPGFRDSSRPRPHQTCRHRRAEPQHLLRALGRQCSLPREAPRWPLALPLGPPHRTCRRHRAKPLRPEARHKLPALSPAPSRGLRQGLAPLHLQALARCKLPVLSLGPRACPRQTGRRRRAGPSPHPQEAPARCRPPAPSLEHGQLRRSPWPRSPAARCRPGLGKLSARYQSGGPCLRPRRRRSAPPAGAAAHLAPGFPGVCRPQRRRRRCTGSGGRG
mmetsp:Transcript_85338/g.204431  ORF Transcript_85338/g.204431 Transcript_85338/m.204431 type:complete len:288 (+) Transcript_85338:3604-4467(+)